ncbi:acyl-CoA dehydrogenase family protein [Patulibacter brassicae]|uniref:Acyl-[acyl-carrier-protein] dehydrogenase MbtN n=2 Tax=Patulibacter brassicae TaxID=1705717 RepID=A0ABU4VJI3_9ACTN|nr:acyl-CoA dehydrogenase family protein [Patulibacter brassicae]MDX8151990.1 acyl-CoA dehydrogenase family protein [Patulibacter brassicae]
MSSTLAPGSGPTIPHDSSAWKLVGGEMARPVFDDDHQAFRESVRRFLEREIAPHEPQWERDRDVPREALLKAGAAGFLGMAVPEEHGGAGIDDFRFNAVIGEEVVRADCRGLGAALMLHNDVALPYLLSFANAEQQARWLPGCASGEILLAIAMTEPGTGSDLQSIATTAVRDGDHYVVNGAKTFITNGINSDLVITAVKTDAGLSLLGIERGTPGFERGRKLEKLGMHSNDTAELFFHDARVPVENLIGEEGMGFMYLIQKLAQERLTLTLNATAGAEAALGMTIDYVRERKAFGRSIGQFQNTRFTLAELKTECVKARLFADWQLAQHVEGQLSIEHAAMGKYSSTDLLCRVVDEGVQLHGGYGYMTEYPIARAYVDARITKIFAGTNEIMKEIIGRGMDLG